ncbi:MAG: hypothetical protein B7Z80_25120 [Rhodospirillales bacterium 20-64-7]|nr:MAG: hypothetical protein B7Z80_25120 [Rhodospirillales bacterium 20-64-7]
MAVAEQLALDASRLLACTGDRVATYQGQGFFKRCWFGLSGKNGNVQRANEKDLIEMQKYAWRYLNLLQERDLLAAHSIITVKNNLMTLAVDQDDIRQEVSRLADRVYNRFVALDERVDKIEASQRVHGWLLTIDMRGYDSAFPPNLRLLRVVNDFYHLKPGSWNIMELRYLQKALKEVGLDIQKNIRVGEFVDRVIEEIEGLGYPGFSTLVTLEGKTYRDDDFIVDEISAPSFNSLYQIKKNYTSSSRVIRSLQKSLGVAHVDAIKTVLSDFITEQGIDTETEVPLKDLAIEILSCFDLAKRLSLDSQPSTTEPTQDLVSPDSTDSKTFSIPSDTDEATAKKIDTPMDIEKTPDNHEKKLEVVYSEDQDRILLNRIDGRRLAAIKGGRIYDLLSVCDNNELNPLVEIIIHTFTSSLESSPAFKLHSPNHIKYYKEIADEIRSFGGHSIRNAFRGSGPEYDEIVTDVCSKFSLPSVKGAVIKNEDAVFNRFAPTSFDKITGEEIATAIESVRKAAKSLGNNKGKAAAGVAAGLVSLPITAVFLANSTLSEAYRVTGPCVFYIAYLRKKVLRRFE